MTRRTHLVRMWDVCHFGSQLQNAADSYFADPKQYRISHAVKTAMKMCKNGHSSLGFLDFLLGVSYFENIGKKAAAKMKLASIFTDNILVLYAFDRSYLGRHIHNAAGLPLAPFRTDTDESIAPDA